MREPRFKSERVIHRCPKIKEISKTSFEKLQSNIVEVMKGISSDNLSKSKPESLQMR